MSDGSDALPLLALSGGLAAAAAWLAGTGDADTATAPQSASTSSTSTSPIVPATTAAWVFPVPSLGDRPAVVSDGFDSLRTSPNGKRHKHLGADIMFKRRDARDLIAVYPPRTTNGSRWFFMPDRVPALAASAGIVSFAKWTPFGFSVVIRHPSGWATYYTHLASLLVAQGAEVIAGQPIGLIGASPTDGEGLKHLHFELWKRGTRAGVVDPTPYLAAWPRAAIADWSPETAAVALRNARLNYRPVGGRGEPYPDWIRRLRGASGVYVIRERGGPIVYVGESSANRLYETLTRHFQHWRRHKGFWRGQFAEGHDPGLTYDRGRVEVAVKVTPQDGAIDEETRLIRRLRPRDNLLGQPELEDAPF